MNDLLLTFFIFSPLLGILLLAFTPKKNRVQCEHLVYLERCFHLEWLSSSLVHMLLERVCLYLMKSEMD